MSQLRRTFVISKEQLKAFRCIDDQRVFATIGLDYLIIFATAGMAIWIHRTPVTLVALVIIAGRQSALQGLVHSASHFSLFSRKRDNFRLQFLFAYPILDLVPLYRNQHLEHHRDFSLRTPDRFDYLYDCLQLSRDGRWFRTWVVFIRPLLGHAGYVFVTDAFKAFGQNLRYVFKLAVYWLLLLSAAWLAGGLWIFFIYWIVPLVWLYPVLDIWAELSDHLNAKGDSRNQAGLFYGVLLKGHEMYHAVHHLYPFVPFYRLRELNDLLRERGMVMETSRGSADFLRIVYGAKHRVSRASGKARARSLNLQVNPNRVTLQSR